MVKIRSACLGDNAFATRVEVILVSTLTVHDQIVETEPNLQIQAVITVDSEQRQNIHDRHRNEWKGYEKRTWPSNCVIFK